VRECEFGDGKFQGFYVCLRAEAERKIAAGVEYELRPKREDGEYWWEVMAGVKLKKR
jgi:hypothetical protein